MDKLTKRENEILDLIKQRHHSQVIADLLGIDISVFRAHRSKILRKCYNNKKIKNMLQKTFTNNRLNWDLFKLAIKKAPLKILGYTSILLDFCAISRHNSNKNSKYKIAFNLIQDEMKK